ncbi:MAG: hypothetical protein Q8S53_15205 [Brevundimonas sp.]|uniref:hypothetical protein n=1 Tax=Brevundimonas sp. TaxID=1871086 RepID=UPI002732A101|nr:hypothetical protein [Brevundimonas sp.]MDP3379711.1 hypothetical protein [Brevundimonas sp.]
MSLLALAFIAVLSGQDPTVSPDCLDDNHTDRCDADNRDRMLARFGAPTIEADAAIGAEVYRALYFDGYGRELPVIAFERRPGQPPQAVFYGANGRRLNAPLGDAQWKRVQREGRFADQQVAAPATPGMTEGIGPICLHAWVTTIEMANAPVGRYASTPVRRRTENACAAGLTTQTALLFSELAQDAFPQCSVLDRTYYRSPVHLLDVCASLEGDVLAASELRNTLDQRSRPGPVEPTLYWSRYLGTNAVTTLDWNGEVIQAPLHGKQAVEFLAARQTGQGLTLQPQSIRGESSREVVVAGTAEWSEPAAAGGETVRAAYTQRWKWDPSGLSWTLGFMTVGPPAPAS